MLKEIRIKNFQSHRNTSIKLHPKLTGIIGLSLSGKTAIVRALNWIINNRPLGFRFHSNFAEDKSTKVSLIFDNKTIKISKNKKNAKYQIKYSNGESKQFEVIGTNVPDLIQKEINLLGINVQEQLEDPFLISSTPGNISKAINQTLQTEKLDMWQSKVTSNINSLNKEKKIIDSDIDNIKKELKKLEDIEDIGKLIRKLKFIKNKIQKKTNYYENINNLLINFKYTKQKVKKNKIALKLKDKIQQNFELKNKINNTTNEYQLLTSSIDNYKTTKKSLKKLEEEKNNTIKEYIILLKKNKKCPTCFEKITPETIKRIKNEIFIT